MTNNSFHDFGFSTVSWTQQGMPLHHATDEELSAEADEPPDGTLTFAKSDAHFKRTTVRKSAEQPQESLLTKALHQPKDEATPVPYNVVRRRSMTSNISIASTAELVSDVSGVTSPSRSNTPSPPPPVFSLDRVNANLFKSEPKTTFTKDAPVLPAPSTNAGDAISPTSKAKDATVDFLAKKRCIQFACGGNKNASQPSPTTLQSPPPQASQATQDKPTRRPCIKFACPTKLEIPRAVSPKPKSPNATRSKSPRSPRLVRAPASPASARKHRSSSTSRPRSNRSSTPRPSTHSPRATRSKQYLSANPDDLDRDCSRFHEFATDEPQEEEWIRDHYKLTGKRITVNDTLQKELEIRRLGKEVEDEEEEEALEEEEEEKGNQSGDGDEDEDDNEDGDDEDDEAEDVDQDEEFGDSYDAGDDISVYGSGDDISDGYHTDNEVGFADSDEDDDAEDLQLWNPGQGSALCLPIDAPSSRRPSVVANRVDSTSSSDADNAQKQPRERRPRLKLRPGTPELPDSTDFVCGTLDEDRALEDAYISCVAARRREKLHVIPQDIDPSFPTSEPEDDDEDEVRQPTVHESDDQLWIHGNMEDINHDKGYGTDRRVKHLTSPRRHRSPPPKRARSPPPKRIRSPPPKIKLGRSPKCLFDRHSPRQLLSPPMHAGVTVRSPPASLVQAGPNAQLGMNTLAFRPGPTQTKSLPRAAALFPPHLKSHRRAKHAHATQKGHVRGAIDIVKGLEQKRQRRKEKEREKYFQKHCNMARKGQIHDKRPQPGKGAERMREIGLLMANKRAPAGFVLSV